MPKAIENLIKENEFPIVFLGSGISKRYLVDFPDWNKLLEEFWTTVGQVNFYGHLNNLRDEISKDNTDFTETELNHYTNIKIGSIIEEKYNKEFNSGNLFIMSIADSFYQPCGCFYHTLRVNLPVVADVFTSE